MFYRRKILLSLLELSGGNLNNTQMQKLLFLYCQTNGNQYYDFFPHKFGAFSHTVYYDKNKLIESGHLTDNKYFEIVKNKSVLHDLKNNDSRALGRFVEDHKHLKSRDLTRQSYLKYPEYAIRSTILDTLLDVKEREEVAKIQSFDYTSTLFTIGYEGISIDEYIKRLIFANVKVLIDVRKNPLSRKHGFSKRSFKKYIEGVGIRYVHFPQLGIASKLRQDLEGKASYSNLFEHYRRDILSNQDETLEKVLDFLKRYQRVALTCFEADHKMCHRHCVSSHLKSISKNKYEVRHI